MPLAVVCQQTPAGLCHDGGSRRCGADWGRSAQKDSPASKILMSCYGFLILATLGSDVSATSC